MGSADPLAIPFNVAYSFDGELRELPADRDEMLAALAWLRGRAADPLLRARALGLIGVYARILGEYGLAQAALEEAVAAAGSPRQRFVNRLRLAHVYQWRRDFAAADQRFAELLAEAEAAPELADYRDFAHQHAGKSRFDQGDYRGALEHFRAAMAIRLGRGDASLIESSGQAIAAAERRLAEGGPGAGAGDRAG